MPVNELYLVRHGESIGNVAATQAEIDQLDAIPIDIRDADVPLSSTGEEQSRALAEWLADHRDADRPLLGLALPASPADAGDRTRRWRGIRSNLDR